MKQANIIVLAGQSNAVGVGYVKYLSKYFSEDRVKRLLEGFENIKISYISHDIQNDGFQKTTIRCTEETKETFGPELGIAEYLNEVHPGEEFFIIKCAFGGSDMHNGWRSPSSGVSYREELTAEPQKALVDPSYQFPGWCYNTLYKLLRKNFSELISEGYAPVVQGFCWMQGEADSAPPHAEPYMYRYDCLLNDVKASFAPYFERCAFVDAGISQVWVDYEQMNAAKQAYALSNGHGFVDTVGAGFTTSREPEEAPDIYHYDADATLNLGRMFAKAVIAGKDSIQ
ncbi:MAG: sialate O-acetylesterase [Ruminococcaceae bacterium]|nr:sialate O-acetylesterase [Oscillospiraceae bacterium]